MLEKFNPWVRKNVEMGNGQLGTFVGSETGADGITAKVVKDDACVNEALCPPPEMENAVLVAGLNIKCVVDEDYTPTVESSGRLRTSKIVFKTLISPLKPQTYGKGADKPNTSPSNNVSPKA